MVHTTKFAVLQFGGGRFETNALAFDALPDLLVYRDLLVDLARHLWLQEHEGRRRAPRRFEDAFPLFLRAVEQGSARAVIEREDEASDLSPYLDRACYVVNQVVEAAGSAGEQTVGLPAKVPDFPADLARHFNRFGRKLRSDEWVELHVRDGGRARYVPTIGKRIALAYIGRYEEEVVLEGELGGVDVHRGKISIRTDDGDIIDIPSCPPELVTTAVPLLRRSVQVTVVAEFDRSGRRERVRQGCELRSSRDEDARDPAPLAEQFDQLRSLPPGWFEPNTPALDRQGLAQFQAFLEAAVGRAGCARPYLYPTPEGDARAEWTHEPWEVAVTATLPSGAAEAHATNLSTDEVRTGVFALARAEDVERLVRFLRLLLPGSAA